MEIYDRQPNESAKAHAAFILYRDIPAAERTAAKVAKACNKSISLINRWGASHKWRERAAAYDAEIERAAKQAAIKAREDMITRHIDIALQLQDKAAAALERLNTDNVRATDIVSIMKFATDLERQSRLLLVEHTAEGTSDSERPQTLAEAIVSVYRKRHAVGAQQQV